MHGFYAQISYTIFRPNFACFGTVSKKTNLVTDESGYVRAFRNFLSSVFGLFRGGYG